MSKKRSKSATGSAGVQRWEQALLSTPFVEEGKWTATVAFVAPNQLEDSTYIDRLNSAVNGGTRKLFNIIAKDELYNQVNELGNPKGKKAKEVPLNYEICEPCKDYLDSGEDIPVALLAKLLKFKLLDIKTKDIKRREAEKKATQDKDKPSKKGGDKKDRSKSPTKGKGGKKTPDPPSAKEGSKLKKRGEEDTDSKYLDDEPDDGTNAYIFVCGFHEPHLIGQLSEIGIDVDSIVKITSEDYSRFETVTSAFDQLDQPQDPDEKQIAAAEEQRLAIEKRTKCLKRFWRDVFLLLQNAPPGSRLHDVARLEYVVKETIIPDDQEDADKMATFATTLYEDTACMLYDMLDAKRQWKNFLANLKLISVPEFTNTDAAAVNMQAETQSMPSTTPGPPPPTSKADKALLAAETSTQPGDSDTKPAPTEVDMRYYGELMGAVPQESVSVPLVMHCMLEQVVASEESKEPPSETPRPPREDGLDDALNNYINTMAYKLALSEDEQEAISHDFEPPKKPEPPRRQPTLVGHRDEVTRRLGHLKAVDGFCPLSAELAMLGYDPVAVLCDLPPEDAGVMRDRAAHLQELLHYCATGGTTAAEVDHAFKQFVLESVDLTRTDCEGRVLPLSSSPQVDVPWDDPYPYYRGMIPREAGGEEDDEVGMETRSESGLGSAMSAGSLDERVKTTTTDNKSGLGSAMSAGSLDERVKTTTTDNRAKSPELVAPTDSRLLVDSRLLASTSKMESRASAGEIKAESRVSGGDTKSESGSRPGSGSILKEQGRSVSRKSVSAHSVHFELDDAGNLIVQPGDAGGDVMTEERSPSADQDLPDMELMEVVNDAQKRNLDQWCFSEHLEPQVFLQVLKDSLYTHPYLDTYYHARDSTLMVVLHNPHSPRALANTATWNCALYSNTGFRNYLEYIAEGISDWTRAEESKYQASLLAEEVTTINKEAEEASSRPPSAKDKKRERSKSPKKSPSRSGKSPSRSSSTERPTSANPFVRAGSLKAWREEQDRVRAEEEEKERQKQEKRARSAQKKASKEAVEDKPKEKRPGSRSSRQSKTSKEDLAPPPEPVEEPKVDDRYWPFTGYDMGNSLLNAKGTVSSLFPADGGQIRTEKYEFVQGTRAVKTCVLKDGHAFTVHVLDPKVTGDEDEEEERAPSVPPTEDGQETERSGGDDTARSVATNTDPAAPTDPAPGPPSVPEEPAPAKPVVGRFGSFCAQLSDGMSLALSTYGNMGEPENGKPYEPKPYVAPPPRSPSPSGKEPSSPSKGKKDKSKDKAVAATPEPPPPEEEVKVEVKVEAKVATQEFQKLCVTCPDGLNVSYLLESDMGLAPCDPSVKRLLVRQSYPDPTRGTQPCEAVRAAAMDETSRVVNGNGSVVKVMKDGTTQVLFADGSVSQYVQSSPLVSASRSSSPQRASSAKSEQPGTPKKKDRRSAKKKEVQQEAPVEEVIVAPGYWITTATNGTRVATAMDGARVKVKDTLVSKATDPQTGQVMYTRDDHTIIIHHPDNTTVVEHADGTRITTFTSDLQLTPDDLATPAADDETGEVTDAPTSKQVKLVQVECLGYATLRFDTESSEVSTEFGNGTIVNTFLDGAYDVYHSDGGYVRVEPDGTAVYYAKPSPHLEVRDPESQQLQYVMRHHGEVVVETIDNLGNLFSVQNTGDTTVTSANEDEENTNDAITQYKQHAPRLFIVNRDGSGTELLRYQDVSEYIADAEDDLSTAILMDPLQDFPGVLGITVMKPYLSDPSQYWVKPYSQPSIMPPGLTSRDLLTLPASEVKTEGPGFGAGVGRGLAVGSLVQTPLRQPVLKCPAALEIRQLLQYKPVGEETREKLSCGLRDYADHVKARLQEMAALQVHDPRSDEERALAEQLQGRACGGIPADGGISAEGGIPADSPLAGEIQEEGWEVVDKAEVPTVEEVQVSCEVTGAPAGEAADDGRVSTPQPPALDGDVKQLYEAMTAPPVPTPPPTPTPKRTQADWERDARERAQEEESRAALRDHSVPGYFNSELGKAFLLTQLMSQSPDIWEAPDVDALTRQLSEDPRRDDSRAVRSGSNTPRSGQITRMSSSMPPTDALLIHSDSQNSGAVSRSDTSPPQNVTVTTCDDQQTPARDLAPVGNTPSALRPGNPTPFQATGQRSPTSVRPTNPTPAHADKEPDRPENPASVAETPSVYPNIPENEPMKTTPEEQTPTLADAKKRSTRLNVVGEPRLNPIQIPGYIRGGRPGARPNNKFLRTEDPVRRKVYTTSLTGATPGGAAELTRMRGLELLPTTLTFGTLREGSMYSATLLLKNTGVDTCRFKVTQPPPSTGMKVLYKPGPVAAGMRAALTVEIYAIAVGVEGERGVGQISHDLQVTTETDHLTVPITATVLTAYDYDAITTQPTQNPGVTHISDKAPGGQGIIRPRKQPPVAAAH